MIFDAIADDLLRLSGTFTKRRYQQYLIAVHHFTKKKQDEYKRERGRANNSLGRLRKERSELIKQRAILITKDLYDKDTRAELEPRIEELSELIDGTFSTKKSLNLSKEHKVWRFKKFLELKRNLHQYWITGDLQKKANFSKIAFLNLVFRGARLAILSYKKPFSDDEKECSDPNGASWGKQLEASFETLRDRLAETKNQDSIADTLEMMDICEPAEGLKFPITSDLEKIS